MTQLSYPAQIVFTESDRGGYWCGRLLNPSACVDRAHDSRPLQGRPFYNIKEGANGRFTATFQGGSHHSRRHREFRSLTAAQRHAIRWAGQRFRVLVELSPAVVVH